MNSPLALDSNITETAREKRVWMTFPGDFKKSGVALLHQQCWCWGFDVRRHLNGMRANLLVEMGFERIPPPEGRLGATTYQKRQDDGTTVTLWGFGFCYCDERGGIFVSRFAFWPRWGEVAAPGRVYNTGHLAEFRAARRWHECQQSLDYFSRALDWIAQYERQAAELAGQEHRQEALKALTHTAADADLMAYHWEKLAIQARNVARFWNRENNRTREITRSPENSRGQLLFQ